MPVQPSLNLVRNIPQLALSVSFCTCHLGLKHREAPLLSLFVILPITYVGAERVGGQHMLMIVHECESFIHLS